MNLYKLLPYIPIIGMICVNPKLQRKTGFIVKENEYYVEYNMWKFIITALIHGISISLLIIRFIL